MKMSLLKYSTAFICAVLIIGAASGETVDKFGLLGGKVSFGPASLTPSVSSIVWKQSRDGGIVKAIEWDVDDGVSIPNPRFKNITTLDEKTGQITLTSLNANHAGTYIFDINSKEQGQRFKLEVLAPVPDPKIIIVPIEGNSDTVYLECLYSETIMWKNSAGETLKGTKKYPMGESLTVMKTEKPENFYTCTLENAASESTSDPVYERDLFKPSSGIGNGLIALIVIVVFLILIVIIFVLLYKFCKSFHDTVFNSCGKKPCIGGILKYLDGEKKTETTEDKNDEERKQMNKTEDA